MSFRSSIRRFRSSLALGTLLALGTWAWLEVSALPRTAYFGGRRLAEKWVRLEQFERAGPVEVLIVGASYPDQGFDARRFTELAGARAFNLGISGTDTYFQSLLLRQLLASGRRPRALVWALLPVTVGNSDTNLQYLASPALSYAAGAGGTRAFELGMHLPQFQRRRMHEWFRELAGEMPDPVDEFGRVLLATPHRPSLPPAAGTDDEVEPPTPTNRGAAASLEPVVLAEISRLQKDELVEVRAHVEETLRLLLRHDVRVWLVFMPFEAEVFQRSSVHAWRLLTRARDGHIEWVGKLARELDIQVIDLHFCAGISEDPSLFYDSTHLNAAGSTRLAEVFAELLTGRRPIPEEWRGLPSRAHRMAILGHEPPAAPARIELGTRVRLDERPDLFPRPERAELYATVAVPEAGDYRLVLQGGARAGGTYARVGGGFFRRWRTRDRRRDHVWALAAGEHRIELLALEGALAWEELALEREPSAR